MRLSQPVSTCFLLLSVCLSGGCHSLLGPALVGSGVSLREVRTVEPFSKIEVGGALNVQVTVGDATSVEVVGDDNIVPIVTSDVRGGTLYLQMDHRGSVRPKQALQVTITTPELSKIQISGACDVEVADVGAEQLVVSLSGASQLEVSGTCEQFEADVSGASTLDAFSLATANANVNVSGASGAKVHATDTIRGGASGASSIRYTGDPSSAEVTSSGASSAKALSR